MPDGEEFGVGFHVLGTRAYETHFCNASHFTWSRQYGQPNPSDIDMGTKYWHIFATGLDVELDDVPDAESDTIHFVYTGIAKWCSCHGGPGPLYLPTRVSFEMLRPKSLSGDVIDKIGSHLLKCKKNKYNSTLCFIEAESVFKRFGARPFPKLGEPNEQEAKAEATSSAAVARAPSLSGLALKVEEPIDVDAPGADVDALLPPALLQPLPTVPQATLEQIVAEQGVFSQLDKFIPGEKLVSINTYGAKLDGTSRLLAMCRTLPNPIGVQCLMQTDCDSTSR